MGDSDDEFDRRNVRDKFHHERNDYERRGVNRRGPTWDDRVAWGPRSRDRRDGNFHDFDRARRDRFSPLRHDASPPQLKRMRRDWEDGVVGYPHFDMPPYGPPGPLPGPPPPGSWGLGVAGDLPPPPQAPPYPVNVPGPGPGPPGPGPRGLEPDFPVQPPMMTFKQFLSSQDDNISDEEAIKRYNEYKTDFRKQQINEFFLQHKDEEWFRSKYHPEEFVKRQDEMRQMLKTRCQSFTKLLDMGLIARSTVDIDHNYSLIRLLDAAVIFMEGGVEFDLKALDLDCPTINERVIRQNSESQQSNKSVEMKSPIVTTFEKTRERKLSEDSTDDGETPPKFTEPLKLEAATPSHVAKSNESETLANQKAPPKTTETSVKKRNREKSGFNYESRSESESGSLSDTDEESHPTDPKVAEEKPKTEETSVGLEAVEDGEERDEPIPRPLHKTLSLFLRNLAPNVTKQEVETLCRRYPGFMRISLQDPQPERRFLRRGWVTFDGTVNIKEICWNLNNIRLRDMEMGAIVNRDLKQRVRHVTGLTVHRQVAKQDLKHAAKIIQALDGRWKLWDDVNDEKQDKNKESFGFISKNPILKNITEYLVDEGSYEEEALLGGVIEDKPKENNRDVFVDRDEILLNVLDRMLLYLRIVYSIDYYSAVEYPNEDEMPHRCGMMHARGHPPPNRITSTEINEWMGGFEMRIAPFLDHKLTLEEPDMVKLGKKDQDTEVAKFILANTHELAKDKWLCPLSGKKFKGPEFVRKHIMAKHMDKVDEVKQEVAYFNNYIADMRRPQLPEHPASRLPQQQHQQQQQQQLPPPQLPPPQPPPPPQPLPPPPRENFLPPPVFPGPPFPGQAYRPPVMYHAPPRGGGGPPPPPQFPNRGPPENNCRGGGDFRPRDRFPPRRDRGPRPDPRGVINYRDLDAPADMD